MVSNIIMAVVLIVLSLVWGWIGIFQLGLWIPGVSADSGFIPTVFAVVTLICAVIMLVQNLKKYKAARAEAQPEEKKAEEAPSEDLKTRVLAFVKKYAPVFFGIFGVLCLDILGLIPMTFLMIFGWMKLMNKFSWVKSGLVAVAVTVVIFLVFDVWLQIPFPGLI